ncbi:MAG: calcium/sodium antiporter [Acholeplasmataceae bacterium]|nr:calcium/sodium antiporter [Acholeplasmataceae bacterium]
MIFLNIIYLVVGFVFLIKGADFFIVSSSSIARKFRISPLIIGLTLVAFGTSLPELAVSFTSSLSARSQGLTADIAMGNIIGSNMANLTLILGTSALIMPVVVKKSIRRREFPFLIGVTVLLTLLAYFFQADSVIVWWEALILLLAFGYYMYLMITSEKDMSESDIPLIDNKKATILLVVGIIGVALGGFLVTEGAEYIAIEALTKSFNMTVTKATTLVGLSIVALGTSLPELVTSAIAAKKGEADIALGNVIGSNIFNILLIVGLSGVIVPLGINQDVLVDMIILIGVTSLTVALALLKDKLSKIDGIILLVLYVLYITFIILRALGLF